MVVTSLFVLLWVKTVSSPKETIGKRNNDNPKLVVRVGGVLFDSRICNVIPWVSMQVSVPLVFQSFTEWQNSQLGLHPVQASTKFCPIIYHNMMGFDVFFCFQSVFSFFSIVFSGFKVFRVVLVGCVWVSCGLGTLLWMIVPSYWPSCFKVF